MVQATPSTLSIIQYRIYIYTHINTHTRSYNNRCMTNKKNIPRCTSYCVMCQSPCRFGVVTDSDVLINTLVSHLCLNLVNEQQPALKNKLPCVTYQAL